MRKILLFLMLLPLGVTWGQWTYVPSFVQDGGNPGGVNTEGDAPGLGTWTNLVLGPQGANLWSPVTPLPFAFSFYGQPVTDFMASQNGLVTFNTSTGLLPNVNDNLPSVNLPDMTICGMWDEFTAAPPTGTGDDVRMNVFGAAPNRQLWIKWYSFEMGNPVASFSYFAVVLEETTNNIYVVDLYSTTVPLSATVGVQFDNSTAVQYGSNNIPTYANGTATTDNDYYMFTPILLVNDDAGVSSLDNPLLPLTAGLQNIDVAVTNFGVNNLNSFGVNWEINGIPQTPFVYGGGPIAPSGNSGSLTVGSYNFPSGFTDVKFWTSSPNAAADGNPLNDTLEMSLCTSLNGVYSIGGAGPDFATINDAVSALVSCGVSGPVTFNIAPGLYNEQVTLPSILGASATNTITFDGGAASNTTITTAGNPSQWAVIGFTGGDYFTWRNLTIEHTGNTDASGFQLTDTSDYNTVENCVILLDSTATLDVMGIVISGSQTDDFTEGNGGNYNTFTNCQIVGGEMGIHLEGPTNNGEWIVGNSFTNIALRMMDDYAIYMDNVDSVTVSNCDIYNIRNIQGDGLYCFDIANFTFDMNEIYAPDYGLYISDGNFDFPVLSQSSVSNNIVKSETDYAIYFDDVNQVNIQHNTAYGEPAFRINDFFDFDIRNNLFVSNNDYAFESDDDMALTTNTVNYNLYWTPAGSLAFVKDGVATYTDLISWQLASPSLNGASIEVQPDFVDANTDLHRIGINGNDMGDNSVGILFDVDMDPRPAGVNVDMGADEYTPLANDATLLSLIPSGTLCGDSTTEIYLVVQNLGSVPVNLLPLQINYSGASTGTLLGNFNGILNYGEVDTVLMGTINTYAGGTLNFEGIAQLMGDQNMNNDTLWTSATFIPYEPQGIDAYSCGTDSALLMAAPGYPMVYEWFDAPTGGNQVAIGNSFMVPSIIAQDTYYLAYSAMIDSIETTLAGGNGCGGGNMFDVLSSNGTAISAFRIHNDDGAGVNFPVNVYYVIGGFAGNETNPGAWTPAGSYTAISGGVGSYSSRVELTAPINLPAGTLVGIYIECDVDYSNGNGVYTSGDVTLYNGVGLCSSFGGTNPDREFNGKLYFGTDPCSNIRTPVTAYYSAPLNVNIGPDTTVCAVNYILDAGNNDPQTMWNWSDGSSAQTLDVTMAGNYWVTVTDSVGCVSSDTANVLVSGLSAALTPASLGLCVGDSVALSPVITNNYPYTFTWSSGGVNQNIVAYTTGVYTFTATDSLGCMVSATSDLSFVNPPVASFTNVLTSIILDVTSTATNADSVVFDFGDGIVVTGSTASHTYTANGTYSVCQYVYNACSSDTSCLTVTISEVGLEELNNTAIALHPNPTTGILHVGVQGLLVDRIAIVSPEGRVLLEGTLDQQQVTFDLSALPSGIYFVQASGEFGMGTKRFVKE